MFLFSLIGVVILIAAAGYFAGRARAVEQSSGNPRSLHSRPGYHAAYVFVWTTLPAFLVMVVIAIAQPFFVDSAIRSHFPDSVTNDEQRANLTVGVVRQVAQGVALLTEREEEQLRVGLVAARPLFADKGVAVGAEVEPYMIDAAYHSISVQNTFVYVVWIATILLAVVGAFLAWRQIAPPLRARNIVERVVRYILIAASTVAILTTAGIIFSLVFESFVFFSEIPPASFFFGTTWDPRFANIDEGQAFGQFGLIPLLWGTLYISLIALLMAVPIGVFAAIYMSEYASKTVRAWAKPALEVLAGIPTIVYGFFALTTVGPLIRDFVAQPLGLGTSGSSVMTAGIVMGIMIIPFVSSLSDDIINAVPQSMRDGSYGLGATKSETIRQVILPAALPGIVGAVLLAASRAIGETMIVVLAAGVATRISLNPFQEMTTITVKIVSQLTGDTEFTSPQTLVAFALGLTLFVVTLCMNVYALYIVRKYREQYE
jgi:phosphate transport system permease protein